MSKIEKFLISLGAIGVVGLIVLVLLIPLVATLVIGIYSANYFHLTGLVWWSYVILFYLVIMGLLSRINK